jgi:hypothetical protein
VSGIKDKTEHLCRNDRWKNGLTFCLQTKVQEGGPRDEKRIIKEAI